MASEDSNGMEKGYASANGRTGYISASLTADTFEHVAHSTVVWDLRWKQLRF
jgi:hypothetical protein